MLPSPQSTVSDISISEDDVYSALVSLDPTKSMGIDGISPKLLKHCALALYQPLHHLFLLTLSQSYIPEEWRTHLITPILKSGDKSKVNNYRPISLLCSVSKVLEKSFMTKSSVLLWNILIQLSLDFFNITPLCISCSHLRSTSLILLGTMVKLMSYILT